MATLPAVIGSLTQLTHEKTKFMGTYTLPGTGQGFLHIRRIDETQYPDDPPRGRCGRGRACSRCMWRQ
ncbi:hypothetical protein AERO9AM_30396 [Aeromicrobium sp. 9AM]|nr:hypothetical protein AERO9AM_30396 [Aeromicrobium sp. 9AM]